MTFTAVSGQERDISNWNPPDEIDKVLLYYVPDDFPSWKRSSRAS